MNGKRVKKLKWQKAGSFPKPGWIFVLSKHGAPGLYLHGLADYPSNCTWDFVQLTIIQKETK